MKELLLYLFALLACVAWVCFYDVVALMCCICFFVVYNPKNMFNGFEKKDSAKD